MTVLNDKLIAQREGNDHAGKESKDIQNQTMVPPDSRVGIENDDHGYCTCKEAGHICLKIGRIGAHEEWPSCNHIEKRRKKHKLHMFPCGFIYRSKHSNEWIFHTVFICKMKECSGNRRKKNPGNGVVVKMSVHKSPPRLL